MGMPITVEILDQASNDQFEKVFAYFQHVDEKFSTYKQSSEISRINRGEIGEGQYSDEMKEIFRLSEETKQATKGFFDIKQPDGSIDPSGIVKGWAIFNAAQILEKEGMTNFYIDAGGDVEAAGTNAQGQPWRVGIKNPFKQEEIIKVIQIDDQGVATSGTYIRGEHIYNPISKDKPKGIVSLTVVGPNVYEADRFATAAFAMGREGINFIEQLPGFEGYLVTDEGIGIETSGFSRYNV